MSSIRCTTRVKRYCFDWSDTWIWESFATLFSLASMLSVIVVLAKYDHQDIALWNFHYNINAVIATLNTISKALSVFSLSACIGQWKWLYAARRSLKLKHLAYIDRCSRGPLGAIQVMWDARISIISIPAFVLILNLASDTFIQQVVTLSAQPIEMASDLVVLPKANNYTGFDASEDASFNMMEAIDRSFSSIDGLSPLPVTCPTGNCSFDPFDSLGVCSSCSDVTSYITSKTIGPMALNTVSINGTSEYCNSTGLSYKNITLMNVDGAIARVLPWDNHNIWNFTAVGDDYLNMPLDLKRVSSPIITTFLAINVTDLQSVWSWPDSKVIAEECSLYFCIQRIQSSVQSGVLTELTEVKSATTYWTIDEGVILHDLNSPSQRCWVDPNGNDNLQRTFNDNWLQAYTDPPDGSFYQTSPSQPMADFDSYMTIINDKSNLVYNSHNLSRIISNLATSMTQVIRQQDTAAPAATGKVISQVILIQVEWKWLILPLFNVLVGAIFFVLTIITSAKSKIPLWKEEILATLMHGFKSELEIKTVTKLRTNEDMEKYANTASVRLQELADGSLSLATERDYIPIHQRVDSSRNGPSDLVKFG